MATVEEEQVEVTKAEQRREDDGGEEGSTTIVFVYGTLKRGFPNHPFLAAHLASFAGAATIASPAPLVLGPYSVPFLLPIPASSGLRVSGELYAASPRAVAALDAFEGTHLGVYERRPLAVEVGGEVKDAEAYFAHRSYAEALWQRCGGEAAEAGEYTMEDAARYVPPRERSPDAAGLRDAIERFIAKPLH